MNDRHRPRVIPSIALTAALLTGATACSDDAEPAVKAADGVSASADAATPEASTPATASGTPSGDAGEETVQAEKKSAGVDPAAQAYVDAVADEDLDALVDAFHSDAELVDVGREFNGHDEIRDWADSEVIGGKLTVLKNSPKSDGSKLLVRFAPGGTGGFEANYDFTVRDGRISELNLTYA